MNQKVGFIRKSLIWSDNLGDNYDAIYRTREEK